MASVKENKENKELLQQIQSIQERTNQLKRDESTIVREIANSQDMVKQAQLEAAASVSKNLSDASALANIDAIRSIQAKAIADGTLDSFNAVSLMEDALGDVSEMSEEVLDFVLQQSDKMDEITKQMQKQDIFGKSIASSMKEANDKAKENTKNIKSFLATAAGISDEFFTLSTLAKAVGAALATTAVESYKLGRGLSSGGQAMDSLNIGLRTVGAQIMSLTKGFMLTGDEARQITTEITMLNGALDDATASAITQVGELTVVFGVATGEAANLHKMMKAVTDSTDEGAAAMQTQIRHLAKAHGVAPMAVMKDIAGNTMEFARFGKDGAAGLVNAAANARKLGLNLEKVVSAGDSFLDVQSSIKNEMKAEMMIGRQLNLDGARAAAVAGDRDKLVREIANNAGTLAEFTQMSVPQQKALAAALGVQVGDVTKILQAKAKGVNLDAKILDAQAKQLTGAEKAADAQAAIGIAGGGILSTITASIPALAGLSQMTGKTFGGMKDSLFGMFSKSAAGAEDVSSKMEKIKTPKGGGKGMTNFFKSLSKIKTSSLIKAALAIAIVAVSLIPAAYAFSLLKGVDPMAMAVFGLTMVGLALSLALISSVAGPVIAGALAFGIAAIALIPAAFAMQMLQGVDPMTMLAFAGAIGIMALAVAGLGLIAPLAIIGAGVMLIIGASAILFASAFAAMQGVDPAAIDTLGEGINSMIAIVGDLGLIQAGKLIIKAAAIAAIGFAILPFGLAIKAASGGDAKGLVQSLQDLTQISGAGLAMAGVGMAMLAIGFMAFLPIAPFLGIIAESLAIITPSLALLAAVGEGLAMAGLGVMAFGMGMFPLAFGLMMAAPFIPLMPVLAAAFVIMTPPLIALAAIAEVMPLIGTGFMMLGFGLMPFAMGMSMLAPYIPLMPTMAESLVIMTPPLILLSTIADILPTMGMGFMMLGMGLQSFAIAMAMIFPFQAVLPILAQTMIDLAPPLIAMAPLGPQIMYLASAIGALGVASAIATIPLYMFAAASYFAAPAVTLLGEASKILGAGLEMVRVPLVAMAQAAPQILLLSTSILALGVSLLSATPGIFAFGAGAWFAMVPVLALAAGLELMVLTADGLTSVGMGLSAIAAGLSDISQFNGTIALLAIAAPALALLGGIGMLGGSSGSDSDGEQSASGNSKDGSQKSSASVANDALLAKIDTLIATINAKDYEPILMIDGRKVGQATARKRGPKGMGD